jgi:hypothetical protein
MPCLVRPFFKVFVVGGQCYSWDDAHPCLSFAEKKPPMVVVPVQGASVQQ